MEKLRGMFPQKVRKEKMPLEQCAFRCCIALIGVKFESVILPLNLVYETQIFMKQI